MTNTALFATMIQKYNEIAYTHSYIFGFPFKGNVYMVFATSEDLPFILKLDKASRGAGYCLRFKPDMEQKTFLLAKGAEVLCSEKFFEEEFSACKYNRGEVFEKLVTEHFGQTWVKDTVPFWKDGDLTVYGEAFQIKYNKANFTNEKQLANLAKRG